jgi:acylphosphatase
MKWIFVILQLISMAAITHASDKTEPTRKHWFISGQVQGVSFRAFTYEAATDLKLKGWVRNLTNGQVEIVAEGPAPTVDKLLEQVKKGPKSARVDTVKEAPADLKETLADKFEIKDSAPATKDAR